jgi:hypothetical protein
MSIEAQLGNAKIARLKETLVDLGGEGTIDVIAVSAGMTEKEAQESLKCMALDEIAYLDGDTWKLYLK